MAEYGLFNDEACGWTAEESVEANFFSIEEAEQAIKDRYSEEDELVIHAIEEPEEENEEEEEEEQEEFCDHE